MTFTISPSRNNTVYMLAFQLETDKENGLP